ncbi:MAG: NPCBM/NEW2 domain-containing protein [Phycisphaerales bacterium]|nr:NPCBM/NEW2 domain-containing protein [Planctomycetota bacterium]
MGISTGLTLLAIFASNAAVGDLIYLSDYLGVPSGSAATAANPPYTSLPFGALPYGFGADCPGTFASSPIQFQDAGSFAKGIGEHPFQFASKRIDFSLAALRIHTTRDLAVFTARVGVDYPTSVNNNGGVFTVLVDGVVQSQVAIAGRSSPSIPVAISVVGASTLSLITDHTGQYNSNHMCWADASITLIGGPCPADLTGDRLVDDEDFSIFAYAYNLLDCADPAMPSNCPADLNRDGLVDDADFPLFVVPYNDLLCP